MEQITVISAFPLKEDAVKKIEKTFTAKHDTLPMFCYELDAGLIGGVLVIDCDNYYDASIKGQLINIKKNLK